MWQRSRPTAIAFKMSFYRRRNDRAIDVRWTNKRRHKQQYSFHIKVVPLNGKETRKRTFKQREKETNNKQTSIAIKLELSQWLPATSPSSFPIVLKNNIHSIITTCPLFSKYSKPRLISLFLGRCTEQPRRCSPNFETNVKHPSLRYVGLQGCKVRHWAVEQHCIKLSHR